MHPEFDVVIPARHASQRFPGKMLADLCGKSMIRRVVERAQRSAARQVVVAVDDERIAAEVERTTSAKICWTAADIATGTDRVASVTEILSIDSDRIIVNVQGDEPLVRPEMINAVARSLTERTQASVATAAKPLVSPKDWSNPNVVKCVVDQDGYALYFSRTAIPAGDWTVSSESIGLHHIGIYGYRAGYLRKHTQRPRCAIERCEQLEQLRVLFHGDRIAVFIDDRHVAASVDTRADLRRVERLIQSQKDQP